MPGRLEFLTTADGTATPAERMRITSAGKIGINIDDNTTGDLQVCATGSANGLLRVGGNQNNNVGLDINYSNSGNTSTIFKQNYVANNAGALMQFDSGYFVWRTGTGLDTALTINSSQNATFAGTVTTAGIDIDGQYQQAVDAITPATTPTVNCALGNFFTLNAASTSPSSGWSFTNVPASCVYSVIIKVTTGGSTTINWNSVAVNGGSASNKIKWNGGAVPAFTAGSPLYIILTTTDTGATWEGTSLIDFATV